MSSTEFHSGKAKKIQFNKGLTLLEKVDDLKSRGFVFDYCTINEDESDSDIDCDNLVWIRDTNDFYQLVEHYETRDSGEDICESSLNDDGSINFILQFYNGGCGFGEMFEEAINNLHIIEYIELTEEQIESNKEALDRLEQEGTGYAVQHYTDGKEYLDPNTRILWKKAGDALNELERYLKNSF